MDQERHITFGPFRLDTTHGRLWRGEQAIPLRPRSLMMLSYLVAHPGRLVTKAELHQYVWTGTHVTDTVLRVCVREIRAALGDSTAAPQYLETVGRQGYRFLGGGDLDVPPPLRAGPIVGRQGEVDALVEWFQRTAQGDRQLVFVSGEAGIGKTTVVDLLLDRLGAGSAVRMAQGQCVEHYGEGEAYLPILEALRHLSRGPDGEDVLVTLRRHAPMWLFQLSSLLSETELERLQRQVQGATSARMLLEFAETLEALTAEVPLLLVLEDLQWGDHSTVELLAYIAQRRVPARLLVLGTYRPVETILRAHPLRRMMQELCGRGQAVELSLTPLSIEAVAAYVAGRLGGAIAAPLAARVNECTEGNALFMVNITEHLVQQGLVVRSAGQWTLREEANAQIAGLPEGLRQFLLRRIEALAPEVRRVLEAASVVGEAFEVAAVAAGAQCAVEDVNAVCEGLAAQGHLIDDAGLTLWPDGTRSGAYRFQHALYQQVLYEQLGAAHRARLHQGIGVRLAAGYGAQAGQIATQLAMHFERAGETYQAVHYWQQVGENAARRNAYHEAIAALRQGLTLLVTQSDSPERIRCELVMQLTLGDLLMASQGMSSREAGEAYTRALAACQQTGETPQLFRALGGLCIFHSAQARLSIGRELGQQFFGLAQRQHDPVLMQEGHLLLGAIALFSGDLIDARAHLEQSLALPAAPKTSTNIFALGLLPRIANLVWLARALWELGYADTAQQRCQEALALAQQEAHPPSLGYAENFFTVLCQCRRNVEMTYAHAETLMALGHDHGFALRCERGRILLGWARAMQGDTDAGVAQIRQGLEAYEKIGSRLWQPYCLSLLAEACGRAGQPETGLQALVEALALVAETDERCWEAEVYRLKGALLLQLPLPDVRQAEACFQQALDVARSQQARSLELRAAISLSQLWQQQGRQTAARDLLAPLYGWFTEGFDTPDLRAAQALLTELS